MTLFHGTINQFSLENGQKYIINRILQPKADDIRLEEVKEVSDINNIQNYHFTLKKMNGDLIKSSDKINLLIFKAIRFLPEFVSDAEKYNI